MKPFFNSISNSNSTLWTHQAVSKVDHFNLPKRLQSLQGSTNFKVQTCKEMNLLSLLEGHLSHRSMSRGSTNPEVLMLTVFEETGRQKTNPKQLLRTTHLCHGHSSFLCEGVVIQVYNLKQWVDSKGLGQCRDARMVNSILWHMDLF